jgi:hypothetical protein
LFDDIIADIASVKVDMGYGKAPCQHLTAEEAGIKPITWQDDYRNSCQARSISEVRNYTDLSGIIVTMSNCRTRVSPWHAIIIVTWIYNTQPGICGPNNPFKLLKTIHPGMKEYIAKNGGSYSDLVTKAGKLLKEGNK